jgi:hypothetical protein
VPGPAGPGIKTNEAKLSEAEDKRDGALRLIEVVRQALACSDVHLPIVVICSHGAEGDADMTTISAERTDTGMEYRAALEAIIEKRCIRADAPNPPTPLPWPSPRPGKRGTR